ncbi:hypothetical protein [Pseudonocardia sp. MH-G8]|uniref:hypothetical protein n=1 Tax=Pseudonocardia sp. MH-G8 TaxID=1854588 RepID=UPI00117B7678|nr:hypothetical protein [Pseudonocardia sp. MH-G8]
MARAVLATAAICAIALALSGPASAAASDEPSGECSSPGPLGALLGVGSCEDRAPLPDLPPLLDPGDLLDPDLPDLPDLPDGEESDEDDEESGDEDTDSDDDADEGSADEDSGDGNDADTGSRDDEDDTSEDTDESDTDEGDTDEGDTALAAAVDAASDEGRSGERGRAGEAAGDAGAGAAVGRAILPGVGDAVDGAESGLDWTGALAAPWPAEPPDPPAGPPPAAADPPLREAPAATPPVTDERGTDEGDDAAAVFVDALPSPADVRWDLGAVLPSLALTLVLLAALALPAGLVNRAAAARTDRVEAMLARLRVPPAAGRDAAGTFAVTVAVTVVAGAVMVGFLEPAFPFDGSAPALLVGLAVALVVVTLAQQGSQLLYVARWWGVRCHVTPFPGFLLLAAVGVVLSRAVGLEPGLVLGTLVAFGTARPLRTDEAGPAVALAATALTAAGGVAWALREPLVTASGAPGSFGAAVVGTALTAVTVAATANLVFALVPLSFLPGVALLRWSPALWAVFACLGGFAFVHVVARPADGALAGRAGLLAVVLGLYLLGAAALWAWLRYGFSWTAPARLNPAPRR